MIILVSKYTQGSLLMQIVAAFDRLNNSDDGSALSLVNKIDHLPFPASTNSEFSLFAGLK